MAVGAHPDGSFLEVKPGMVELSLAPGKQYKGRFVVRNTSSDTINLHVEIVDGWKQQIGRSSVMPPDQWLRLKTEKKRRIRPGREDVIPFVARAPLDGQSEEVLAIVFFSGPPQQSGQKALEFQFRHGIPIYMSPRGEEKAVLRVEKKGSFLSPEGELGLSVTLGMEGNAHVRPKGEWIVSNFFGVEEERIPLSYGMPIFPGAKRDYVAQGKKKGWSPGAYKAKLVVQFGDLWGGEIHSFQNVYDLKVSSVGVVALGELSSP